MDSKMTRWFLMVVLLCSLQVKSSDLETLSRFNQVSSGNKCEIEISTRGTCMVNNRSLKPHIVLHFKSKHSIKDRLEAIQQKPEQETVDKLEQQNEVIQKKVIYEFVVQFINLMKKNYLQSLEPLVIEEMQFVQLRDWGTANVYDLKIYGLRDIEPLEASLTSDHSFQSSLWKFNVSLHVANLTANFKVDANIKDKIFIKNWTLILWMSRCLIQSKFALNFDRQELSISSLHIKSFENFKLISETLSWPFNEIVSNIVNQEKHFIRNIVELNALKYINLTLSENFDLNSILKKIFQRRNL